MQYLRSWTDSRTSTPRSLPFCPMPHFWYRSTEYLKISSPSVDLMVTTAICAPAFRSTWRHISLSWLCVAALRTPAKSLTDPVGLSDEMGSATAGIANTPTASTRNKNFPLRRAAENWTAFERRFPCTSHSKESREGARWCALWAKENSGRQCCTTASFAGPVEAGVLPRTAVGNRLPYSWWYRLLSPEIGNPLAPGLNLFFVAVVSPGHTFAGAACTILIEVQSRILAASRDGCRFSRQRDRKSTRL